MGEKGGKRACNDVSQLTITILDQHLQGPQNGQRTLPQTEEEDQARLMLRNIDTTFG